MEIQRVNLSEIAESVAEELRSRPWPAPIDIRVQPDLYAAADPGLMRILLDNAMENACKYSPNGGEIEVGTKPGRLAEHDLSRSGLLAEGAGPWCADDNIGKAVAIDIARRGN